ncbi:MAG: phenylalanine--tRNA ligase beta subunit-related protein [Deltaproteobacteria bacterium]|nr:phenylalanine--tRNA ligase beta subunit-related protein [Deltaproteobacteria bacterium]
MKVRIDDALVPVLRVGLLRLDGLSLPADAGEVLWREIDQTCRDIRERHAGGSSGQVPGVEEARRLYWSVGIDPTRTRPSSEALLRRVVKGKDLYRVHPLVDLFNLASLLSLLPVGLYDEGRIAGHEVLVRLGEPGWAFEGIRKGPVHVGDRLCVADAQGPFGSPTSDSLRTSIEGQVPRALAVFFQPADGDPERLRLALDTASDLAARHMGARVAGRIVIG